MARPVLEHEADAHDGEAHQRPLVEHGLHALLHRGDELTGDDPADDLVDELGGSFSAEHGVGQAKKSWLAKYRGGPELDLMVML